MVDVTRSPSEKVSVGRITRRCGAEVLQDRFRVSYDHVLGEGSYATVYKGLDRQAQRNVAIKVYKGHPEDDAATFEDSLLNFHGAVDIMSKLKDEINVGDAMPECSARRRKSEQGDGLFKHRKSFHFSKMRDCLLELSTTSGDWMEGVDFRKCFAELISYSMDKDGKPGPDADTGRLFIVTDIGEETLAERLQARANVDSTFDMEELRELHWSLVTIVCGLHASGYVHLDIKPLNIMRFGPPGSPFPWRLIDFDGCVKTQTVLHRDNVLVTPWYMAPEIAELQLRRQNRDSDNTQDKLITVSRLMDVWSVGMCALEAVFLQPVLKPWYDEWMNTKHATSQLDGCTTFLTWLQDFEKPVMDADMCEAMDSIDKDMSNMLRGMLSKDPTERSSISECLVHQWFEPIRRHLAAASEGCRKGSKSERRSSSKTLSGSRACLVM